MRVMSFVAAVALATPRARQEAARNITNRAGPTVRGGMVRVLTWRAGAPSSLRAGIVQPCSSFVHDPTMAFPSHALAPAELAALRDAERTGRPFVAYRDGSGELRLMPLDGDRLTVGRAEA